MRRNCLGRRHGITEEEARTYNPSLAGVVALETMKSSVQKWLTRSMKWSRRDVDQPCEVNGT